MKKRILVIGLLVVTFLFSGCTKSDAKTKAYTGINYNQYQQYGHWSVAWTPEGTYYADDQSESNCYFLHYLNNDGEQCILCSKPECNHMNEKCEASIGKEEILFYKNKLCYIEEADNHDYVVYSMNKQGKERKKLLTLPFGKVFDELYGTGTEGGSSVMIKYYDNIFVVMYSDMTSSVYEDLIYWVSLDQPSEIHKVDLSEKIESISWIKVSSEWFYWLQYTNNKGYELVGYNIKTQKEKVLLDEEILNNENGDISDFIQVKETDFYWFEMGKGLWHKNIKTDEKELVYDASKMGSMAQACIMSEYVVISNTFDIKNPIKPKEQSIQIIDLKGKEICQIMGDDVSGDYAALCEDKNNIYLKDFATGEIMIPAAFIKKSEIKNGSAKVNKLKDLN